ncbi:MAG TPA: RRXRR domain-containing protein, partial [Thermaerobacter sp.]
DGTIFALKLTYDLRHPAVPGLWAGDDPGGKTRALSVVLPRARRRPEEVLAVAIPVPQGEVRRRLEQRRAYRRLRRYRLRGRPARFANRRPPKCWVCGRNARPGTDTCRQHRGTPQTGLPGAAPWLPPSVKAREDVLLRVLAKVQAFLPIRRVTVEVGRFDLQKLRDPDIAGEAYQRGPRYGHDSTLAALVAAYGDRCAYCGGPGPLTIDHVLPRSRGGTNAWENLLPACWACNQAKGNRTPEEWGVRPRVKPKPLGKAFRMATWTQQGKGYLLWRLRQRGLEVRTTFGVYTAWARKVRGAEKSHFTDAGLIALSDYPSAEAPEVPLAGLLLEARPAAFRPRQVYKAERYPEARRPSQAVRLSSGWARPVRVNAGVRLGSRPQVLRAGMRRGVPRTELVACGDLIWLEGESRPVVVTAIRSRGTIVCVRPDGTVTEVSARRIRKHRPRPGIVLWAGGGGLSDAAPAQRPCRATQDRDPRR